MRVAQETRERFLSQYLRKYEMVLIFAKIRVRMGSILFIVNISLSGERGISHCNRACVFNWTSDSEKSGN